MGKEHLTYFKVENFKRFDSLELTDIGQFNLIVGDNNVGKTSVLEAISVLNNFDKSSPYDEPTKNLCYTLLRRGMDVADNVSFFFKYLAKNKSKAISFDFAFNQNHHSLDFKNHNPTQVAITYQQGQRGHPVTPRPNLRRLAGGTNLSLIPANIEITGKLHNDYQSVLNHSLSNKRLIINNLKVIDNRIVEIEVLPIIEQPHVMIGFDNSDLYMPITGMGESAVRVFYYLLQIIRNRGQHLLIDEIDTGIHYSRMKGFLKNIIQLADNNQVQLFVTTHSLECQQAFAEVFEEPDMVQHQSKARNYTLVEKPDGQVAAQVFNFDAMKFSLDTGFEIRGGAL